MEEKTIHPMAHGGNPIGDESLTRQLPPAHYTFRIESFSRLSEIVSKSGVGKYESGEFEVGGFKWRLSLYPDGDKKRNAGGHISLYLVLSDSNKLKLGYEVNAFFKLFVYDQVRDNYLTFQGSNGKPMRFHAMKTEHGFQKLLSLRTFKDVANGYLIDDCCVFGAEVVATNCTGKGESFSLIEDPQIGYFTWKVDNFSKIEEDSVSSQGFTVGEHKWCLDLYPNGDSRKNGLSMSLFLTLEDYSNLCPGQKLYAECELRLKDQVSGNHFECLIQNWFCAKNTAWGYSASMPLSDLRKQSNGYIVEDTLIVEAQITLLSMVKISPENTAKPMSS